jgi:hypothetical protein
MKDIKTNFSDQERELTQKNLDKDSIDKIMDQLKLFVNGVKIPILFKPCIINDGILKLNTDENNDLLNLYNQAVLEGRVIKFVPASGAASRMFQKLQSVLNKYENKSFKELSRIADSDKDYISTIEFLKNISKFAFYDQLKSTLDKNDDEIQKLVKKSPSKILKAILGEEGLNYSFKPKGAIKFHNYSDGARTAFEEQVYESFHYLTDRHNNIKIHFTISEEHTNLFFKFIDELKLRLSKTDFKLQITYSYQKKSTDTIAVDLENKLIFDKSGNLVQRPGGHGALLENLNDLKADIVIIKNIDNLSTDNFFADTILYKKLLTGYLVKIQNKAFDYLNSLERKDFSGKSFDEIMELAEKEFFVTKPADFENWTEEQKHQFLFDKLNRPIRVCGMVKNAGEPGGGPFWVKNEDGSLSLQIVEQVQINMNDENQKNIFKQSTHFNPVDLVCGLRDYKGSNFDLHNFVDHQSGIITKKSKDGIELKALELPGLWNGSMADWITIFVEVPISTFNPVKEVNDLLRKEHQN